MNIFQKLNMNFNNIGHPPYDYYFLKNLDEKEYPRYLAKLFYMNTGEKLPLKFDFKNKSWIIDKKRCKTFNQKIQWIKLYGVTDLMRKCTDKVLVRDYVAEKIGSGISVERSCPTTFRGHEFDNVNARSEHLQSNVNDRAEIEEIQRQEYLKPVLQVIPDAKETDCGHICPPCGLCRRKGNGVVAFSERVVRSSRVDFSQPKQDVTTYFDQIDWEKLPNSFVIKCNHGCKWQYADTAINIHKKFKKYLRIVVTLQMQNLYCELT